MNSKKDLNERRSSERFAIELDTHYRVLSAKSGEENGSGRTINMSSKGVLFVTDRELVPGRRLELAINWPVQLDRKVPLKLIARGRVVRANNGCAAVHIEQHEFRTHPVVTKLDRSSEQY